MKVKNLPSVALVGLPNSGKSTLFNRLTHSAHAIISDIAHTTRDTNKGIAEADGRGFEVVDTAGYTNEQGQIPEAAMGQLATTLAQADVICYVVDGTVEASNADAKLAKMLHASGKPVILVASKADNTNLALPAEKYRRLGFEKIVFISAIHGHGMDELASSILEVLPLKGKIDRDDSNEIKIAILGRPNVGKSSLLNALAGEKLAIEADIAGTTRDTNEF